MFAWNEARQAYDYFQSQQHLGKVVIRVRDEGTYVMDLKANRPREVEVRRTTVSGEESQTDFVKIKVVDEP